MIASEAYQVDCDTAQLLGPEATATSHVTGDAAPISLDVLVLLDDARGAAIASVPADQEE